MLKSQYILNINDFFKFFHNFLKKTIDIIIDG